MIRLLLLFALVRPSQRLVFLQNNRRLSNNRSLKSPEIPFSGLTSLVAPSQLQLAVHPVPHLHPLRLAACLDLT